MHKNLLHNFNIAHSLIDTRESTKDFLHEASVCAPEIALPFKVVIRKLIKPNIGINFLPTKVQSIIQSASMIDLYTHHGE